MDNQLSPRQIVNVTVIEHLPYGLSVRLKGGQRGIVRTREISWERAERIQPSEIYPKGMKTEAMVMKVEEDSHLELSFRLVEYDPWKEVLDRIQVGAVVEGVVTGVKNYGVFIEISPGLTGLLHYTRLPTWAKKLDLLKAFWPGDHARVRISKIDVKNHKIDLSMEGIQRNLQNSSLQEGSNEHFAINQPLADPLALDELVGKRTQLVLLVEDDLGQAKQMSSWLTKLGQRTLIAETAEISLELVLKEQPDLAIVDFGLPQINGLELIERLKRISPKTHCFLATDWMCIQMHLPEIEALKNIDTQVMVKPILPEDLIDALLGSFQDTTEIVETDQVPPSTGLVLPTPDTNTRREAPSLLLEKCCQEAVFDYALLFSMDLSGRKVEVAAKTSHADLDDSALGDLIHSPVRDVAEDRITIKKENLPHEVFNSKFHYLQKFCRFSACLGLPVLGALEDRYALFLFSRSARPIRADQITYAQATAVAIGGLLEKHTFELKAGALHHVALLGQMASNLVHEINHSLSFLDPSLEILAGQLNQMNNTIDSGNDVSRQEIAQASDDLKKARESLGTLYKMTRLFGTPFSQKKEEYIRLDELVSISIRLLEEITRRNKTTINLVMPEKLTFLRGHASSLLQVLWNLLLNAIEQISEIRPKESGSAQVRIESNISPPKPPTIRILVEDNGPGIHSCLWDRIFEIGFTTRKDGNGLGLYISRGILQALGGQLFVQESFILGGTTFVIELPHQF